MRNKTKSKIIIDMSHIDHAAKLFKFLKECQYTSDCGGDLILENEMGSRSIGHDVEIKRVRHIIFKEEV